MVRFLYIFVRGGEVLVDNQTSATDAKAQNGQTSLKCELNLLPHGLDSRRNG